MITVVIETSNSEDALARTLATLVDGAVEGVVLDVVVVDHGSHDRTETVAEHAGCHFVAGGDMGEGLRASRGSWILFLEPGARMANGWMEPALTHMGRSQAPARFRRSKDARLPFLARMNWRRHALANGLLVTKRQAQALARKGATAIDIARGLSARQLSGEIVPVT